MSVRLEEEDDSQILNNLPKILNTEGWQGRSVDEEALQFADESIVEIARTFEKPLSSAGMTTSVPDLLEQWHILLEYATKFLPLTGISYLITWRKLFSSPRRVEWNDILTVVELMFTFPVSNAKLERMFSKLKRVKTDFRASIQNERLEHLLRIVEDGPAIEVYEPTSAMRFWASAAVRRPKQRLRKPYKNRIVKKNSVGSISDDSSSEENESGSDQETVLFDI